MAGAFTSADVRRSQGKASTRTSRRDPKVSLSRLRECAAEAMALTNGRRLDELDKNRLLLLAVGQLVKMAGEAATQVPPEMRKTMPQIPWSRLIGLRNLLVASDGHRFRRRIWQTIKQDLPALVVALDEILDEA